MDWHLGVFGGKTCLVAVEFRSTAREGLNHIATPHLLDAARSVLRWFPDEDGRAVELAADTEALALQRAAGFLERHLGPQAGGFAIAMDQAAPSAMGRETC